jgi:hypothetical protein
MPISSKSSVGKGVIVVVKLGAGLSVTEGIKVAVGGNVVAVREGAGVELEEAGRVLRFSVGVGVNSGFSKAVQLANIKTSILHQPVNAVMKVFFITGRNYNTQNIATLL